MSFHGRFAEGRHSDLGVVVRSVVCSVGGVYTPPDSDRHCPKVSSRHEATQADRRREWGKQGLGLSYSLALCATLSYCCAIVKSPLSPL